MAYAQDGDDFTFKLDRRQLLLPTIFFRVPPFEISHNPHQTASKSLIVPPPLALLGLLLSFGQVSFHAIIPFPTISGHSFILALLHASQSPPSALRLLG